MICFFDLEGPLCPIDHAADVIEGIGRKLGKEQDFYQLFKMISDYDDELFLVDKKEGYWPGDTLKLIAPIVVSFAVEEEMVAISQKAEPTEGAVELFDYLHKKDIPTFIISTSYSQHAHTIAEKLSHPIENVRCTKLDFSLKPQNTDVLNQLFDDIFPRFLKNGLAEVKRDLDKYFFDEIPKSDFGPIFEDTIVCGGGRKKENVIDILQEYSCEPDEAFSVGDSITDIQMLDFIRKNGGTAVSFNGNIHSLKPASIAYSGKSILPLKRLIDVFPETKEFILNFTEEEKQELIINDENFHLVEGLSEVEFNKLLSLQKKYRKLLREKAAQLT